MENVYIFVQLHPADCNQLLRIRIRDIFQHDGSRSEASSPHTYPITHPLAPHLPHTFSLTPPYSLLLLHPSRLLPHTSSVLPHPSPLIPHTSSSPSPLTHCRLSLIPHVLPVSRNPSYHALIPLHSKK